MENYAIEMDIVKYYFYKTQQLWNYVTKNGYIFGKLHKYIKACIATSSYFDCRFSEL